MPRRWWILLLLVGGTLAVFGQVVGFQLVKWDDPGNISLNPFYQPISFRNISQFWVSSYFGLYIPFTYTFWGALASINQLLGLSDPFDPRIFHIANLLLHIATTLLVYQLLRTLLQDALASCFGALLFAIHPMQAETVCWATEAKGLISAMFSLAAVLIFVRGRQLQIDLNHGDTDGIEPRPGKYGWATLFFVLALLSKPSAVSVPLIVWSIDRFYFGRSYRQSTAAIIDWIAIAVVWVVVTRAAQPGDSMQIGWPIWTRPFIAMDALAFYLKQLLFPMQFAIDYGHAPSRVIETGQLYWSWIPVAIVAIVLFARPMWRVPRTAAAISFVVLLPVLGLVPFGFQMFSTTADRYAYLAMLGPAMFLGWILTFSPRMVWVAAATVLVVLSGLTWRQADHWKDSYALFQHAIEVNPRSHASLSNLAVVYQEDDQVETAEDYFKKALQVAPGSAEANIGLASLLMNRGDTSEAFTHFQVALEESPHSDRANAGVALIYARRGEIEQALAHFRLALNPDPSHAAPTLIGTKRASLAERYARIRATHPEAAFRNGEEALRYAQEAVDITNRRSIACMDTLAAAYAELGQFQDAIRTAEEAVQRAKLVNQFDTAGTILEHIELYDQQQPLRERPGENW